MTTSPRKGLFDLLAPGVTLATGLWVLAGLAGVLSAMAGSHKTWLSPVPWVLIGVTALLLFGVGTMLARAGWRGVDAAMNSVLGVVGVGLLAATAFLALWKSDQERHALLQHKIGEMASLLADLDRDTKKGLKPNPELLNRIGKLGGDIDDLKSKNSVFSTKADVEQTVAEAIDKHEKAKPKQEPVSAPAEPSKPPEKPKKPAGDKPGDEDEEEDPKGKKKPAPKAPTTPPTGDDPVPSEEPSKSGGKQEFMTALAGLLAAAGLPMGVILAILAVVGQLFSMGVKVEDLGPIVQAVTAIHKQGGAITPDEIQKILKNAKDPETAAKALELLLNQPQMKERMSPEARKAAESALRDLKAKPSGEDDDGKKTDPKDKEKGKKKGKIA